MPFTDGWVSANFRLPAWGGLGWGACIQGLAQMARFLRSFTAVVVVAAVAVIPGISASATTPLSASAITDTSGNPITSVSDGDTIVLQTDAAVSVPGTSAQVITQLFNPDTNRVTYAVDSNSNPILDSGGNRVPAVKAPIGYTVGYTTNGTTWSSTAPPYDSGTDTFPTLRGVRATGSLSITGYVAGATGQEKVVRTVSSGPSVAGFKGSDGGDGWDVFFGSGSAADRVFNVWHHSEGSMSLDCHIKADGTACWTFGAYTATGYDTSAHSTGAYDAATDSVWVFVAAVADGSLGMVCVKDVSTDNPVPCTTPYVSLDPAAGAGWVFGASAPGDMVTIGTQIYARGTAEGSNLLCLDMVAQAPCSEQPYSLGSPPGTEGGSMAYNRLLNVSGKVYFATGSILGCFDPGTAALCAGFNSGASVTPPNGSAGPIFYSTDAEGVPTQICLYGTSAPQSPIAVTDVQACYLLDGSLGTFPSGLGGVWEASSATDGWGNLITKASKFYFWKGGDSGDVPQCFDFATNAACAGFLAGEEASYGYAFALDPTNAACIWSNGDSPNGITNMRVYAFDATTGGHCLQNAAVTFTPENTVPALSCSTNGAVRIWDTMTLTAAPGLLLSNARVSVRDASGSDVTGWVNIPLTNTTTGVLDLSTLTAGESSSQPTFLIKYLGSNNAVGTSAVFKYSADAPQLCTQVIVQASGCPTGIGVPATGVFPYTASVGLTSKVTWQHSATTTTETSSATISRDGTLAASACVANPHGYVYYGRAGTTVARGLTVLLLGPDGRTVLARTTTDSHGHYTFSGIYPALYFAATSGISTLDTTVDNAGGGAETQFPDLVIPSALPPWTVAPSVVAPPAVVPPNSQATILRTLGDPVAHLTSSGPCVAKGSKIIFLAPGVCIVKVIQAGHVIHTMTMRVSSGVKASGSVTMLAHTSVYFYNNSSRFRTSQKAWLDRYLPKLRSAKVVVVTGFVSRNAFGITTAADWRLARARANVVANYLAARGVHVSQKVAMANLPAVSLWKWADRRTDVSWTN